VKKNYKKRTAFAHPRRKLAQENRQSGRKNRRSAGSKGGRGKVAGSVGVPSGWVQDCRVRIIREKGRPEARAGREKKAGKAFAVKGQGLMPTLGGPYSLERKTADSWRWF